MSYDLVFKSNSTFLNKDLFSDYFQNREHYTLKCNQAWYENENTGVYFSFSFGPYSEEDDRYSNTSASFVINLNRPSFFANEAVEEIAQFVREFDLQTYDLQQNSGFTVFNRDRFIQSWQSSNRRAITIIDEQYPQKRMTFDAQELHRFWHWNYNRESLQKEIGDDVFVPKITMVAKDGILYSFVIWVDAIPIIIPKVDLLLIPRKTLAPKKFFKKTEDLAVITYQQMLPLLQEYAQKYHNEAICLKYVTMPEAILNYIKQLKPNQASLEVIRFDLILDKDLAISTT